METRIPRKPRKHIRLPPPPFQTLTNGSQLALVNVHLGRKITLRRGGNANDLQGRPARQRGERHRVARVWTGRFGMCEHDQGTDRSGKRQDRTRPFRGDACWSRGSTSLAGGDFKGIELRNPPAFLRGWIDTEQERITP